MSIWRKLAITGSALVIFASACGDDSARRASPDGDAGAAGEASETGGAGGEAATGRAGGAGGEAGVSGEARVDLASYCQAVGDGWGAWLTYCYGSEAYPQAAAQELGATSRERCLASEPSVQAGRLSFDEVAASACVQAIETMNCDGFDFIEGLPVCQNLFAPLVAQGGTCFPGATRHFSILGAPSECADGYCDVTGEVCPGECAPLPQDDEECAPDGSCLPDSYCAEGICAPRAADGDPCTSAACRVGSSCLGVAPEGDEGSCVPRSVVGQACTEAEPCSFGFYCLAGECRSKVDTGDACEVQRNCPDGDRCLDREGDGATCGAPGGDNEPCGQTSDCVADHYCSLSVPHVCMPRVASGDSCADGQSCALSAWCNLESGKCQASGAAGDSCLTNGLPAGAPDACRAGLLCMSNGQCQPVAAAGEPCNTINVTSCAEGLYCSRVDFTCQPPGEEGDVCNPHSSVSCAGDLGCLCDDPSCESYGGDPRVNDTLHTCLPRRKTGDPCLTSFECVVGSSCIGDALRVCQPDPTECLPD